MLKHVARHDQKRAVLLFKQVPGEPHMALIVYPDTLPQMYHDSMMKCLESEVGQQASDFGDALGRNIMDDGRNTLEAIHKEGYIRKVPTNQVILTPNVNTTVRLDELNQILDQMNQGDEAKKKLRELDESAGLHPQQNLNTVETATMTDEVMTDTALAKQQLQQAKKMEAEAKILLEEAKKMQEEAFKLAPDLKPKAPAKKASRAKAKTAKPKAKSKAKAVAK